MEGAMAGIPAIALSQAYAKEGMGDTVPFAAAEAWAERVLRPIIAGGCRRAPSSTSISRPCRPAPSRGVRVAPQGRHDYARLRIVQRTDPRGYDYFWFGLAPMVETPGT
jgi:5'-nucleotidase